MSKGGGGGTTQTISKADPWSGIQPFLTGSGGSPGTAGHWSNPVQGYEDSNQRWHSPEEIMASNPGAGQGTWIPGEAGSGGTPGIYQLAQNWFNSSQPQYYPGSTVADRSWATNQGLENQNQIAGSGMAGIDAANAQIARTANGDYMNNPAMAGLQGIMNNGNPLLQNTAEGGMLNKNPYVDSMFNQAAGNVSNQYKNTVMPQLASMYSQAGRYGSGAMNQATDTAQHNYGDTLNNLSTNIYGQNYANERQLQNQAATTIGQQKLGAGTVLGSLYGAERNNQLQASGMAPALQQAKYMNNDRLLATGQAQDQYLQQLKNADIARWDFGQNTPFSKIQAYNSILNGGLAAGGTQNSQTTAPNMSSPLSGAMGGASLMSGLGGLATGAMGPSLVGAGLGSAGLSSLGMLGGPIGMGIGALLGGVFS